MDFPTRKQVRLQDYDYSAPGAYFVTVCTQDRRCILSHITVGADALGGPLLTLSETGKIVEKYILSSDRIDGLRVEKYVIMPNHIHLLLRIDGMFAGADGGPPRASAPTYATIPSAIGALKRLVHREAGQTVFQRSYHEHVIRGEADYREIWRYIDTNPAKWAEDRYFQA